MISILSLSKYSCIITLLRTRTILSILSGRCCNNKARLWNYSETVLPWKMLFLIQCFSGQNNCRSCFLASLKLKGHELGAKPPSARSEEESIIQHRGTAPCINTFLCENVVSYLSECSLMILCMLFYIWQRVILYLNSPYFIFYYAGLVNKK